MSTNLTFHQFYGEDAVETLERIGKLRVQIWRQYVEVPNTFKGWLDEFDLHAHHWVCFLNNSLVAAARLSIHSSLADFPDAERYRGRFKDPPPVPIASFNRLVVDKCVRGQGLSTKLDQLRLQAAETLGCRCAIGATTDKGRIEKMKRVGFQMIGNSNILVVHPILGGRQSKIMICHLSFEQMFR